MLKKDRAVQSELVGVAKSIESVITQKAPVEKVLEFLGGLTPQTAQVSSVKRNPPEPSGPTKFGPSPQTMEELRKRGLAVKLPQPKNVTSQ